MSESESVKIRKCQRQKMSKLSPMPSKFSVFHQELITEFLWSILLKAFRHWGKTSAGISSSFQVWVWYQFSFVVTGFSGVSGCPLTLEGHNNATHRVGKCPNGICPTFTLKGLKASDAGLENLDFLGGLGGVRSHELKKSLLSAPKLTRPKSEQKTGPF